MTAMVALRVLELVTFTGDIGTMKAFQRGIDAWPEIHLSVDDFQRYLTARGLADDAANGDDLYLACACLQQVPAALREFEATYMSRVRAFVSRLPTTPEFLDDLRQLLREKLFVGPTPKLAEYSGKGNLGAWLRVVSIRMAIDVKRSRGEQMRELESELEPQRMQHNAMSPELDAMRNRYRPHFQAAFADALAALPMEQRRLLRLRYVDGLGMEELARHLGANRSTIFRRLNACTQTLLEGIRERLRTSLGVTSSEIDSLTGALQSELEISLGDCLKSQTS
jgi:RNA polymerase sigma-70 factor (ECF subfamily)